MADEKIDVSYPNRSQRRTTLSAPGIGGGDVDPFALLRGLRLPEQRRRPAVREQVQSFRPSGPAAGSREYDYEPTFGQLGASGQITPYTPGMPVSGLSPVVATGYQRVRRQ